MAYDLDHQSSQIRALTDTISVPPYIPVTSPSAKRKRDVLLYISPISTNSSFNGSSTTASFGSDSACDGREKSSTAAVQSGGDGSGDGNMRNGSSDEIGKPSPVESEVPSPRTKVANKLQGLNLSAGSAKDDAKEKAPSKAAKLVKSWRNSAGIAKFTAFSDSRSPNSRIINNTDISLSIGDGEDDEDPELTSTPRKKRATIPDSELGSTELKDSDATSKKRKGKAKPTFKETEEMEMTTVEVVSANIETDQTTEELESPNDSMMPTEPTAFVESSKQAQNPRRRLRSPPPVAEDEGQQNPDGEGEETDSDRDESGIGFRPTALQREIRNQKRMQQIKEYKARESREARAKRTAERRRRNVTERGASATSSASSLLLPGIPTEDNDEMADVQKLGTIKKVHFAE
ncbi:hypothetical protein ABW20_dc0107867 [Dactylellina cionopaga]|nr:hypothetical protein ABW20_dc0107867 [Dactylellina cionopaga]